MNKYNLPWMWLVSDGQNVSSVFSDGGGIVAQCVTQQTTSPFAYKLNGTMLMKAISTLDKEQEVVLEQRHGKLCLRAGKTKAELPTYDAGRDLPSVEAPSSTPDVAMSQETMVRLVKFSRGLRSNICFRDDGTAGCYNNFNIFACKTSIGTKELLLPQAIAAALNYLGPEINIHAVDEQYAILSTGNIAILYKHDRYTDHKLDKRMLSEEKTAIGAMRTPSFSNFKTCGADSLVWDNVQNKVRQYNVAELMYEEDIDGELREFFTTSIIPELGPDLRIERINKYPIFCFDFGEVGIYASNALRDFQA
jgi:hypothetical protein